MAHRNHLATWWATALVVAALAAPAAAQAESGSPPRNAVPVHVLAKQLLMPATFSPPPPASVATNDRGAVLAMWQNDVSHRVEWASKRPGRPWTDTRVKGRGFTWPFVAAWTGHRIAATWLDASRRVVVETWSPTTGWSRPIHLTTKRHVAHRPVLAGLVEGDHGQLVVGWDMGPRADPKAPSSAMVAVRRSGHWVVSRAGKFAYTRSGNAVRNPIEVGVARDGTVTAAWEQPFVAGDAHAVATRLPAGSDTWEPLQDFGDIGEWYFVPPLALAVQPDGSAAIQTRVFTADEVSLPPLVRIGDGSWTESDVPFGDAALTTAGGGFVTSFALAHVPTRVFEDPDGLAGPAPAADLGAPRFPSEIRTQQVFATTDGTLVAVAVVQHSVVYALHRPGGGWSATRTAYRTTRSIADFVAASMSANGVVTVLSTSRTPDARPRLPKRLDVIQFDAARSS